METMKNEEVIMIATRIKLFKDSGTIESVWLQNIQNQYDEEFSLLIVVSFIEKLSAKILVKGFPDNHLIVVNENGKKYLRSKANDTINDNLLKLPRIEQD